MGARGNASTTWPRRERDVAVVSRGWMRTARPWHGRGEGGRGLALRRGCARTRAGPGCPGPRRVRAVRGARRGGGRATAVVGRGSGASGSCKKRRHGGRRERRSYELLPRVHRWPMAHADSRGERKEGRQRLRSPMGLKEKALGTAERRGRRVGAVQGARQRQCSRTGAGAVELRWRRPPRSVPGGVEVLLLGLSSSSSSSSLGCGGKAKWVRVARAPAAAVGFLWGGPRAQDQRRLGLLGVRAGTRGDIEARGERG
jgi:hypothetical protein